MHNREADILQIKKYLNGELDAKAMHKLEKMAQSDPFLMDALEGYEFAGGDQQDNLDELSRRINLRVSRRKATVLPLRYIGIAATLLIVCFAGLLWLYRGPQPKKIKIVAPAVSTEKTEPKQASPPTPQLAANKPALTPAKRSISHRHAQHKKGAMVVEADAAAIQSPPVNQTDEQAEEDTATPVTEMIAMEYGSKKEKNAPLKLTADKKAATTGDTVRVRQLQASVKGLEVQSNFDAGANRNQILERQVINGAIPSQLLSAKMLRGRVIGSDDRQPIPGATVKISGTNTSAVTDANGYFRLKADTGFHRLEVGFIGYQTQQVSANVPDTNKTITLYPSSSSLNEVVVTGYDSQPKKDGNNAGSTYYPAKPAGGWRSYHKYLQINAVSPDGKKGVVKLSFMVDRYGSISQIKVEKSVSQATDQKAIDMINAGPNWVGSSDNKPQKVSVRIRFPGSEKN